MRTSQHAFAAEQYGVRARDYVTSAVHSAGADLDQIEAELRGQGIGRALDLGCGGGHVSYRAAPHVGEIVACDVTPDMLEVVRSTAAERGLGNISVRQSAAEHLPFSDGEFDIVLCRFTVHHWHNAEAGLREARRVLKAGGRAIFIDAVAPADPVLDSHLQAIELLRDVSHVRDYSIAEWVAALARSGFALDSVTRRTLWMDFPVWVARTRTLPAHQEAIRSLLAGAPPAVREHFRVAEDGSWDLDTATFIVRAG